MPFNARRRDGSSAGPPAGVDSRPVFPPERLQRLSEIEAWHFWFAGRRALLDRLVARHVPAGRHTVLDVGCGTGFMLGAVDVQTVGVDLRPEGLRTTRRALPGARLVQADVERLPFRDACFDVALLLDVIEHTDDRKLVEEVCRVLRPGGVVLIVAPAMPWLWSYRDEAAGHRRRYTRRSLAQLLSDAPLVVREMRYYQFLLFPLVVAARLFARDSPRPRDLEEQPTPLLNTVLTGVNRLEARLGDVIRWPWGSSVAAVCVRPRQPSCSKQ
jgi:SAM-dependent methyltransferase